MKLLAILTSADGTPACLDAATVLARVGGTADVQALNVKVDPEQITAASEEIAFQRLRESEEGTAQERTDATQAAFTAWSAQAPRDLPQVRWTSIVGPEEEVVTREAAQADVLVIVLTRENNMDGTDAFDACVYRSGKPTLLVPADWRAGERRSFDHVVVALSDSDIAEHAIVGAGPVLRAATKVTALRIGEDTDPAMRMIDALRGVGVEPELHVVVREGTDLGAQIAAEAQALGADLIVAGAYRHGEIVEWLMGGTTRHLLAAAKLPLLLAH